MDDSALSFERRPAWSARERWLALGLFVFAFGLRLLVLAAFESAHPQANTPVIDEAAYDAWARRIAAGDWIGEGVFFQEPLYSYLLGALYALVGESLHAARVAQSLLGAATSIVVLLLARRLFGRAAGWIAGVSWAVYRPALWFPTLLLKENVFALALLLLALLLVRTRDEPKRWWMWGGLGVVAGAGALLRGNLLVMLPLLLVWPFARARLQKQPLGRVWPAAASMLAGIALVLAPVLVRNRVVGGEFALTTSGAGTNLYGGNNLDNPNGVATEFPWVRGVPEHEADDWRHEAERRVGSVLTPLEVSAFWRDEVLRSLREHPLEHARILGRKFLITLGAYEVPDNHFLEWDARYVAPLRWPWPGFGVLGPLALFGVGLVTARRVQRGDRAAALEVALLALFYLGTIVLTVTSDRIRFALVPLLLPFAAFALLRICDWLRFSRKASAAQVAGTSGLGLGCVLLVWAPMIDATERANDFDERDFNLASGILRANASLATAEEVVARLQARHPESVRVDLLESDLDYRRARELLDAPTPSAQDRAQAERRLDAALARLKTTQGRSRPQEAFRVSVLAGAIQQYLGQFAAAARHYAKALEFDPQDFDVLRRRGVCLANAAMQQPAGAERTQGLAAALEILEALPTAASDAELARLIAQIRAAR